MSRKFLFTFVLLLSGLSGISYEILYGRILGGMLGDQFAVSSAVLITFLLGIGVGAKYAHRFWRQLWLIEALIGVYGIGFALSRNVIDHFLYNGLAFLPGLPGSVFLGSVLLLFPAILIGCSVPLFAGYLGRMDEGPVFSRVYTLYNIGAATTAILIEFWLIRQFGISGTVLAFGLINLLAAALLFAVARPIAATPPERGTATISLPRRQIISLILVSIASAVFQLFMVKISELMFGPFRETFALVLAIILFGIAFGSFLVRRMNVGYAALLLWNVFGLFLVLAFFKDWLSLYANLYKIAVEHGVAIIFLKGAILFLLMGIPAVTFGATIPALLNTRNEIAMESGTLLFISSLANVAGFLLMALLLHQYLDYGVQLLVISALVATALGISKWGKHRWPLAAGTVLLLTIGLHQWKWDEDLLYLSYTSFQSANDMEEDRKNFNFPDKFKGYQDVFSINWLGGKPYFFINGYISFPMNNPSEKIVGTVASMFAPRAQEGLVLGLGSGTTASAVGLLFDHTDVVEINPVVRANQYRMTKWNFDIEHNPRVNIMVDDAIHYTKSTTKDYDMILNTVTSPLYFSSSKLYTRDFFEVIKTRLRPDGIYATWMDTRVGGTGAEIILNTLKQNFKHCAILFIKSGYFLLIASDQPVRLQHPDLADKGMPLKMDLLAQHERIPRDFSYNLMTADAFSLVKDSKAPINTIDYPALEFEMARLKKEGFANFKEKLVAALNFDDVRAAIEPAMEYDPVMHAAQVNYELGSSFITDGWNQQGYIHVKDFERRLDEATLQIYSTLATSVNDAKSHHSLGYQYMKRKRYDEALAEYRKALQLDPKNRNTVFNIGACYEYEKQYPLAIESYELAGKQNPEDADVPYRLSRIYLSTGKHDLALEEIIRALKIKPSEKAYLLYGKILEELGRKEDAVKAYWQALALDPNNSDVEAALNRNLAKW